jgi:copper chaperone CopZ
MKYKTVIPEIHCDGCVALIKTTIEEVEGFRNIVVDKDSKTLTFESDLGSELVKSELDEKFEELEPHGYIYTELSVVDEEVKPNIL